MTVDDPGIGAAPSDESDRDFWLRQQLGFTIRMGEGRATTRLKVDERHLNPHGAVHGAVLFALIDTAMGAAATSVLGPDTRCATIEIHTRFLAPVFGGEVQAEATVIKAGRRIVHLDAVVTDADGQDVVRASGSFAVLPAPAAGEGLPTRRVHMKE